MSNMDNYIQNIEIASKSLLENLTSFLTHITKLMAKDSNPSVLRSNYDEIWDDLLARKNEVNQLHDKIINLKTNLENSQNILDKIITVYSDSTKQLNNARTGPLEALAKEAIKKKGIRTDDPRVNSVLNSKYNGGQRKTRKSKKSKKCKYGRRVSGKCPRKRKSFRRS